MQEMELLTADTLLEKGVLLPIKAPLIFRLFGMKQLKFYRPSAGNQLRIDSLYLKMGISDDEIGEISLHQAKELELKHTYTHCRIIAIAMFKGILFPWLLNRIVAVWLKWNLNQKQIMYAAELLLAMGGTANFMNTTRLIREMKITTPGLGQKTPKKS
ncbi:hypothetical protein DBR40_09185 [Pedobacter sp. KBW01]|uniref:hypothetical protein n=1 Tax=Pedobacter sp. KBW01 TaxID=2153364 RepID=UPI000F5A1023|nr:hypothetical protein [Pedobacter sp. KBW01]RQO78113.1 hypothetical protein DBR40_09185 [Pedobacter sp. KBW01]